MDIKFGNHDITITMSTDERELLGSDVDALMDWVHTALWGLLQLRRDEWDGTSPDDPAENARRGSWQVIAAIEHRLTPRLEGIANAAIRTHWMAGASIGDLATAMDCPRATAQTRRNRVVDNPPGTFEQWATGVQARAMRAAGRKTIGQWMAEQIRAAETCPTCGHHEGTPGCSCPRVGCACAASTTE